MTPERWACWIPWVVGTAAGLVAEQLVGLIGEARTAGLYGLLGVALGWAWYRLHPRPLAERARYAGVIVLAMSILVLLFGGEVSHPTVRSMIGIGVCAGLVLAETRRPGGEWRHQKQTALTSRQTMRELR